jgi:hypothetical protein
MTGITIGPLCDWGDCDEPAVAFRNDRDGYGWLAACEHHLSGALDRDIARVCVLCASEPCVCHLPPDELQRQYEAAIDRLIVTYAAESLEDPS